MHHWIENGTDWLLLWNGIDHLTRCLLPSALLIGLPHSYHVLTKLHIASGTIICLFENLLFFHVSFWTHSKYSLITASGKCNYIDSQVKTSTLRSATVCLNFLFSSIDFLNSAWEIRQKKKKDKSFYRSPLQLWPTFPPLVSHLDHGAAPNWLAEVAASENLTFNSPSIRSDQHCSSKFH